MKTLIEITQNEEIVKELQLSALEDIKNLCRLISLYRSENEVSLKYKNRLDKMYNYTTNYIKKKFNLKDVQIGEYLNREHKK